MRITYLISALILGAALAPAAGVAAGAGSVARGVQITTRIKAKLTAAHIPSLARLHIETDRYGVVRLRGPVQNRQEMAEILSTAQGTEGVESVRNQLSIRNNH